MEEKIYLEKNRRPEEGELKRIYGVRYNYWLDLVKFIDLNFGQTISEWKYYGTKYGWGQKLFLKKRNFLFFTPYKKYFAIGMIYGEKAVAEISKSDLPKEIIDKIKKAKKYAEGRGFRIEVKSRKNIENLKSLVRIKILN